MPRLPSAISALSILHQFAGKMLQRAGYRVEVRQAGERKIGLWRRSFRKMQTGKRPRRFVIVPGWGDSPLSWTHVLALLAPILRHRFDEIIIIDFPGYRGFLSKERAIESMDQLRQATKEILDSLRPEIVLGYSLGGWLSAWYVSQCPTIAADKTAPGVSQDVSRDILNDARDFRSYRAPKKVILVNPSGISGGDAWRMEWENRFRKIAEGDWSDYRKFLFHKEPFWFRYVFSEIEEFFSRDEVQAFLLSVKTEHYLDHSLSNCPCEFTLLWGEGDQLLPPHLIKSWRAALPPGAKAYLIPKGGHMVQIERPTALATVLGSVLLDKTPPRLGSGRLFLEA